MRNAKVFCSCWHGAYFAGMWPEDIVLGLLMAWLSAWHRCAVRLSPLASGGKQVCCTT